MSAANAKLATVNHSAYLPFGLAGGRRADADDFVQDDILSLQLQPNKPKILITGRGENISRGYSTSDPRYIPPCSEEEEQLFFRRLTSQLTAVVLPSRHLLAVK